MKKAYRRRYKSYFSEIKLPALISSDLIATKLLQLRAGDKSVRDDLIIHYLRLVFAIVGRIQSNYPKRKHNDLLGAGILALVECLDSISTGAGMIDHDNLDAYVHKTIYHEIKEFIKTDYLVRPPLNSEWLIEKIKEEGTDFLLALFGTTEYFELSSDHGDSKDIDGNDQTQAGHTWGLCTPDPSGGIEVREIISSFHFTTKEKRIIEMRMEGSNFDEIGAELGMSRQAIIKRVYEKIAPRLRTLLGE
jgi:DNA-directed RNA polymerase specialized sigma subunit